MKKVHIIVLNYNGAKDTLECLESLSKISYKNYDIVLVDNCSTDDSVEAIEEYLSKAKELNCTFLKSEVNGGYGHGNNIGIKHALDNRADYILVLNNDTIVTENFLEPLVKTCEEDPTIGIASGKIYFYDKPNTIWFNGGKFNKCSAKVEHFHFNEVDVGQVPTEPISFISGCMWLVPRKVFEEVGFINEDYFMYVEDLEFCQRVLESGYTMKIAKNSSILHNAGASSGGQLSSFSIYWMAKNKIKFISNNLFYLCKFTAYLYTICIVPSRWLIKGRFKLFYIHISGVLNAFEIIVKGGIK